MLNEFLTERLLGIGSASPQLGQTVDQIVVWETPKIRASYRSDGLYSISKQFHFSASSVGFGGDNFLARLVMVAPELDRYGFVFDLALMKAFDQYIGEKFDHRDLSGLVVGGLSNWFASSLYEFASRTWGGKVGAVRIIESSGNWIECCGQKGLVL